MMPHADQCRWALNIWLFIVPVACHMAASEIKPLSETTDCPMHLFQSRRDLRSGAPGLYRCILFLWISLVVIGYAQVSLAKEPENVIINDQSTSMLSLRDMLAAGGSIGYVIVLFSFLMVALIIDHMINIRRSTLMPPGLAEEIHRCLSERRFDEGKKYCIEHPGFLSRVLHAGLDETGLGYGTIEKAMEDAAIEQSARLFRRIEYLSVISTLAPMLGLMGTVWGMIQAFLEFEQKANPQVSELAPGIYRALITTLLGLGVAVPSLAAFAIFRSRIEELAAETVLLAEHVFADHRRLIQAKRQPRVSQAGQQAIDP